MFKEITMWRLRPGADRRFRGGHPWVYSNELAESPKGVESGAPVELRDAKGAFLARGYGNPSSLIAFRALSRDETEAEPFSPSGLARRLLSAARAREALGMADVSYRLCFGEADRLPGLVIDRFILADGSAKQAFVVQAHSAGMDRSLAWLPEVLEQHCSKAKGPSWKESALVIRNDVGIRKLEGLAEQESRVERAPQGADLAQARIVVASALGGEPLVFHADLIGGQKTGFFLDQSSNVRLAVERLASLATTRGKKLRILDLCCYVGQWSAQLARAFKRAGVEVEVTAVDASAPALELARRNIELQGAKCETLRGDVLRDLASLKEKDFDIVISDPPAFIKGRKDIPTGTHAYLQLNTQVFRLVKRGGAVVCCSCSSLLEEEEFLKTLGKAARRNFAEVRWIGRGSQSPDHPMLAEFPEGRYLKAWIGLVAGEEG